MISKKHLVTLGLAIICTLSLAACNKTSYPDNLSAERIAELEEEIATNQANLTEDISNNEREDALFNIAFAYGLLGQTKEAISYYEQQLEISPSDYRALNNVIDAYTDLEDYDSAYEHYKNFHFYYKDEVDYNASVVRKGVRLLIKLENYYLAQNILQEYATNYQNEETTPFISEQFELIKRVKDAESSN